MRLISHWLLLLFLDLDARQRPERSWLEEAWGLRVVLDGNRGCLAGAPRLQKVIVGKLHAKLDDLRREEVAAALCTDARRRETALCVEARHDLEEEGKVDMVMEMEETPVTSPATQRIRERFTFQKRLQTITVAASEHQAPPAGRRGKLPHLWQRWGRGRAKEELSGRLATGMSLTRGAHKLPELGSRTRVFNLYICVTTVT